MQRMNMDFMTDKSVHRVLQNRIFTSFVIPAQASLSAYGGNPLGIKDF